MMHRIKTIFRVGFYCFATLAWCLVGAAFIPVPGPTLADTESQRTIIGVILWAAVMIFSVRRAIRTGKKLEW